MALLAASGQQARFHGTTIIRDILSVSEEVMILSICLDINVKFRFNNILPVSPEELQRAQVLFNFLAIVRHFVNLLGPQGISELVEDFKNITTISKLSNRKVVRTRSRRYGLPSPLATRTAHAMSPRRPLTAQDINHNTAASSLVSSKDRGDNTAKRNNRLKRQARVWNNENALLAAETERRERIGLKIRAGFV
ncbi:hypothetical protein FRC10_004664 [Ceratobasidium sp. 414]|nr:hypothetical protein FRC10_004664 [Ceratobasidium sp. 414]